jgi:hypothetical protein
MPISEATLSLFGQLAEQLDSAPVHPGESVRKINFTVPTPHEGDALALNDLMNERGIDFRAVYFTHGAAVGTAKGLLKKLGEKEARELLPINLPIAVRALFALLGEPSLVKDFEQIVRTEAFFDRLMDRAFSDAKLNIMQEEVHQAVEEGSLH